MPSILADQHPDCWGALDFVDSHMNPVEKTCIIESTGMGKPPQGKQDRVYFVFKGDRRKCFLKKTARVFICNQLRTMEGNEMIGAGLRITARMAKNPKGDPPEVLSMTVIGAAFPKNHKAQQQQPPEETKPIDSPDPTPERGDAYEGAP